MHETIVKTKKELFLTLLNFNFEPKILLTKLKQKNEENYSYDSNSPDCCFCGKCSSIPKR